MKATSVKMCFQQSRLTGCLLSNIPGETFLAGLPSFSFPHSHVISWGERNSTRQVPIRLRGAEVTGSRLHVSDDWRPRSVGSRVKCCYTNRGALMEVRAPPLWPADFRPLNNDFCLCVVVLLEDWTNSSSGFTAGAPSCLLICTSSDGGDMEGAQKKKEQRKRPHVSSCWPEVASVRSSWPDEIQNYQASMLLTFESTSLSLLALSTRWPKFRMTFHPDPISPPGIWLISFRMSKMRLRVNLTVPVSRSWGEENGLSFSSCSEGGEDQHPDRASLFTIHCPEHQRVSKNIGKVWTLGWKPHPWKTEVFPPVKPLLVLQGPGSDITESCPTPTLEMFLLAAPESLTEP